MRCMVPAHLVDDAVAEARTLPGLVANLRAVDPALAAQLEPKALIYSRTPIVTLVVMVVAWLSARYGLGWDATTDNAVACVCVVVASYLMRLITRRPIDGWFATPAGIPPAGTSNPAAGS